MIDLRQGEGLEASRKVVIEDNNGDKLLPLKMKSFRAFQMFHRQKTLRRRDRRVSASLSEKNHRMNFGGGVHDGRILSQVSFA
ncbi:unnamed protein product [Linum trigynum]|uniref:Uncharacterized protein n=1 Tax=Linum trigynum TaxID=586398 RepID=A0AAV2CY17_9ROSI